MRVIHQQLRYSATDLANFLACGHLTSLDLAAAGGLVAKPYTKDLGTEALIRRGENTSRGAGRASSTGMGG